MYRVSISSACDRPIAARRGQLAQIRAISPGKNPRSQDSLNLPLLTCLYRRTTSAFFVNRVYRRQGKNDPCSGLSWNGGRPRAVSAAPVPPIPPSPASRRNILDTPVSFSSSPRPSRFFRKFRRAIPTAFFPFSTLLETVRPICRLTDTLCRRTVVQAYTYVPGRVSRIPAASRVCVRRCNARVCERVCAHEPRSCKWSSRLATYSLSRAGSCTLSADAFESSCQL